MASYGRDNILAKKQPREPCFLTFLFYSNLSILFLFFLNIPRILNIEYTIKKGWICLNVDRTFDRPKFEDIKQKKPTLLDVSLSFRLISEEDYNFSNIKLDFITGNIFSN